VAQFKPAIILSQTSRGVHSSGGPDAYAQYIRFLERKAPPEEPVEQFAGAYMDYLQAPLQVSLRGEKHNAELCSDASP
jgi:protein arginine N-methyltransferase 5